MATRPASNLTSEIECRIYFLLPQPNSSICQLSRSLSILINCKREGYMNMNRENTMIKSSSPSRSRSRSRSRSPSSSTSTATRQLIPSNYLQLILFGTGIWLLIDALWNKFDPRLLAFGKSMKIGIDWTTENSQSQQRKLSDRDVPPPMIAWLMSFPVSL